MARPGASADLLSILPYAALILLLYLVGREKPVR